MMVAVAGLAMWEDYFKAVTSGMLLLTFQIMSKGDMREGRKRVLLSHFQLLLARNIRLQFAMAENYTFAS